MTRFTLAALYVLAGCAQDEPCYDDNDQPTACEELPPVPEEAEDPNIVDDLGGIDAPADFVAGPDDLDGLADEAVAVPLDQDPDTASEVASLSPSSSGTTAIDGGRTHRAELRRFLPIGRTPGASRYVVMRLRPADLPSLQLGDVLRAASELQVTTRCDIGQVAPGCDYSPHVALQLVLSGDADGTDPHGAGTVALSPIHKFECSKDDHHCVKVIEFGDASLPLDAHAPPCVADNSCFVNLVAWAYNSDARSGGQDVLLLGANEGDFLANHAIEQDRGRIMAVRERGLGAGDVSLRETLHDVRSGSIELASTGAWKRIYSHTLAGGADLHAGDKYRVWANVDASSNARVNLSLLFFVTTNRFDRNGGGVDGTSPAAISEHNGTNCSPGNDCHLRKVAVFEVDRDINGPVYVNIAAATEVPGPGAATTTIHDTGYIKALHYNR